MINIRKYSLLLLMSFLLVLPACTLDSGPATPVADNADLSKLPHTPATFEQAKQVMYRQIYADHPVTIYCGCSYDPHSNKVDWASCGFRPRKNPERASRTEAEHVMPAHQFGNFRQCWREPETVCPGKHLTGRKCCELADPVFNAAHNDLNNLYPAVGEVNGDRSNFNWGMVPGEAHEYGACPMKIDESIRRAEPPDAVKGNVARTMFYMERTYGFKLSDQDRKLFTVWSRMDPPDDWEIERNQRIARIQGQDNPFVSHYGEAIPLSASAPSSEPVKRPQSSSVPVSSAPVESQPVSSPDNNADSGKFSCKLLKSCSQMRSCEEAKFQLTQCGNQNIDGNHDGIPCAKLCR